MTNRSARAAGRFVFILCCVTLPPGVLWAQNENETVGFQSNHIYESGHFGENIDILDGSLMLGIPIGPQYQVNAKLGYQVRLAYDSKVWDMTHQGSGHITRDLQALPANESPVGIGFNLGFGRIFVDSRWVEQCDLAAGYSACWIQTYKWVAPDGSQHEFYYEDFARSPNPPPNNVFRPDPPFHPLFTKRQTSDLSYTLISGPLPQYCTGTGSSNCFRVETPDGLVYTLSERLPCLDPSTSQGATDAKDAIKRATNRSYCGWYTTRIEDRSVVDNSGPSPVYPVFVSVNYNDTTGYKHVISSISDSSGRAITVDSCQWQREPSTPPADPGGDDVRCIDPAASVPYDIHAIAIKSIEMPAFGNSSSRTSDTAKYRFVYELSQVKRANHDFEACCIDSILAPYCTVGGHCTHLRNDPVLKLVRIDYPPIPRAGAPVPDRYSMYFSYTDIWEATGYDYGELACRTLPLGRVINGQVTQGNPCDSADPTSGPKRFRYHHDYYGYADTYLSSGYAPKKTSCPLPSGYCVVDVDPNEMSYCVSEGAVCTGGPGGGGAGGGIVPRGFTRQLVAKTLLPASVGQTPPQWVYDRPQGTTLTNPPKITATDPFGNDTVYWFHASAPGRGVSTGAGTEDGFAPEWNDGTTYRIDYYEGDSTTGRLVRSVLQDYDADRDPLNSSKHLKVNVRVKRTTTQYVDDAGRSLVVSGDNWDEFGHWKTETQSGFEVQGARVTYRAYAPSIAGIFQTDRLVFEEVTDGSRMLARTDSQYDSSGRLQTSIARATPLGMLGTGQTMTSQPGDVTTTYTYSSLSGNVLTKTIATGLAGDHGYGMKYTYAPDLAYAPATGTCPNPGECGGYLATKQFLNPATGLSAFSWNAIERIRDCNTGLIISTKDPSGYQVTYGYDKLGRMTTVTPNGEEATQIDYPSLLETTVTQGDSTGSNFVFTRYRYDGLGRLVATQKRSADSTKYSCQKAKYDAADRVTFQSEWRFISGTPNSTCIPDQIEGATVCSISGKDCGGVVTCASDEGTCVVAGTTFDFRDPASGRTDPFGRVRRVIPTDSGAGVDDKSTLNEYFGNSTRVTTKGLRGAGAVLFPSVTVFYRDGFNRLNYVDSAPGNVCSLSGRKCSGGAACPTGEGSCLAVTGNVCSLSGRTCDGGAACPASEGSCLAVDGGASATYSYDMVDNLVQVDLSDGPISTQTRRFAYDGLRHLKSAQNPENGTVVYGDYDALGNLLWLQDASGNRQNFAYDNAGRTTRRSIVPSGGGSEKTVSTNTYDQANGTYAAGKLTTIASNDEAGAPQLTETRFYDEPAHGRLSRTTHQFADWGSRIETTTYAYDPRGQLIQLSYPQESPTAHTPLTVAYGYSNGQVVSATESGVGAIPTAEIGRVTYNAAGAVATVSTPGGGLTTIVYDSRNRPRTITGGVPDASTPPVWSYQSGKYLYDGAGNIYQIGTNSYAYDAASRLIVATTNYQGNAYVEQFTYDAFGNMRQKIQATNGIEETDNYTFPASNTNRVATRSTTTGSSSTPSAVSFFHDTNGNLIEGGRRWYAGIAVLEDVKRYEYGVLNRLSRVHQVYGGTELSEIDKFGYDSGGNRIWKLESAEGSAIKTYYVRDAQGQGLSEFRAVSTGASPVEWAKDTIYLAGRLLAMKENLRPKPPSGLYARQDQSQLGPWRVGLLWRWNTESDSVGYSVYRRQGSQGTWSLLGQVDVPWFNDPTDYTSGTTVYYRVTCRDSAAFESLASATVKLVTGDVSGPTKPTLSGTAGDRRVVLSWTVSTDASGIAGYEVSRRTLVDYDSMPITSQLVTETTYTDLNLTNGTIYYYLVRAKDTAGNWGSYSCRPGPDGAPCGLKAIPKDYTPPVPPMGVKATSDCVPDSAEKVTVSWDRNPDTDGVGGYEIYGNTSPVFAGLPPIATRPPSELSYSDTAPPVGVTYYYAVKAVDSSIPINRSAFSLPVAARARDHTKTPTVRLGAFATDGSVQLRWTSSDPVPDKYLVYRKLNVEPSCGSYVQVGSINHASDGGPPPVWSFTDGGVPNNAAYDYAVTALFGQNESSFSRPVLAIPVARVSNFYQCSDDAFPSCPHSFGTEVFWNPPVDSRPYQPIFASPNENPLGYLKGYHLYHHRVCQLNVATDHWQDDSPMTEVEIDPNPSSYDRYLVNDDLTCSSYRVADSRYGISISTPLKPPVPTQVTSETSPFEDCKGSNSNLNCVLPKAVYKVFAEGTWLTVESDWPDYWHSDKGAPEQRCGTPLRANPPSCLSETHRPLPPTNVTAVEGAPGTARVSWTPASQPVGVQIAGYYLYGRFIKGPPKFDYLHPLPFKTLGADLPYVDVTGLVGGGIVEYRFGVAAFDSRGQLSTVSENSFPDASPPRTGTPLSKIVLWTVNDAMHPNDRSRRGVKIAWNEEPLPSGYSREGFRVYRSSSPFFENGCALLNAGANPPNVEACTNDTNGSVGDPNAASATLTTAATGRYYWDRTVAHNRAYHYRVTEIQRNTSNQTLQETSLTNANNLVGKELPFEPNVLPPPTGLRAWAPWTATEKSGVYLKWCGYKTPNDLPGVSGFKIYRSKTRGGPYDYLATVDPGCLQDGKRCAITSVASATPWPATACVETTGTCEITDQTFATDCSENGCGGDYPCRYTSSDWARYYYVVTAVSVTGEESMASAENGAWLNYRHAASGACSVVVWDPRREPDGNGDTLVCGEESARLLLNDDAVASPAEPEPTQTASAENIGSRMAPHRTIGQVPNPYDPPARFVFYHLDHLGSPRVVLDRATPVATVLERHHYLPFGEERPVEAPTTINARAFTGHERDSENGLDYMMARYYSSSLARFMAVDPLMSSADPRNPQTWNRYTYALNNPLVLIDPLGLYSVDGPNKDQFNQQTSDTIGMPVYEDENGNMQRAQGPAAPGTEAAVAAFDAASAADFTIHADSGSDVAIDNYDTQTVNPGQIGALPSSAPAGSPQSSTQGEVVTHILSEYTAGSASGFAQGSFPAAHERGMEAQNQYRAGRGQVAVTSTETSRTKNMLFRPLTGNFRTIDFNRADGGRTRVTIQQSGWFTPAGVTVE